MNIFFFFLNGSHVSVVVLGAKAQIQSFNIQSQILYKCIFNIQKCQK